MAFDLDRIQALIKFVSKSGVSEIDLETEEFKINVKNSGSQKVIEKIIEKPALPVAPIAAPAPVAALTPAEVKPVAAENDNLITVKSPMIGTFYRSPSPDKPVFVNIGDSIEKGKVLCIIEAMKLFNEIEAEVSGKIVKVLVDDTKPVEYDQPLFLVEPN